MSDNDQNTNQGENLQLLLKPPFKFSNQYGQSKFLLDFFNLCLFEILYTNKTAFDNKKIIENFIVDALNEKWEKEYGERLRWEYSADYSTCPRCRFDDHLQDYREYFFPYCPICGIMLLPPEGKS